MTRYAHLVSNLSNWWLHLAHKFGLTRADPLIFRTRSRVTIEVPRRLLHEFKEIFMEECYMMGLGRPVPENPVVIDIGANAGFFSLFTASRFPGASILAYEPIANNFKQLERNVLLNNKHQIKYYQKAVYGTSGVISLSFDSHDTYTTAATVFERSETSLNNISVPCITLPEILEEHQLERCDFLKMDCEGSEYDILYKCPGHCLRRISQMAMEVHQGNGPKQNITSLIDYLSSHDFTSRRDGNLLWAWREA